MWGETSGSCCLLLRAMCVTFLTVSWGLGTPEKMPPLPNPNATSCTCTAGLQSPLLTLVGHFQWDRVTTVLRCLLPCS